MITSTTAVALESAALDPALREGGNLAPARPSAAPAARDVRRVRPTRSPAAMGRRRSFPALHPVLRSKLDARPDWTDVSFAELSGARPRRLGRPEGPVEWHGGRQPAGPGGRPRRPSRSSWKAGSRPWLTPETILLLDSVAARVDVGRTDRCGGGHRGAPLAPAHRQRQAVVLRLDPAPLRWHDYCEVQGIGAYGGGRRIFYRSGSIELPQRCSTGIRRTTSGLAGTTRPSCLRACWRLPSS